MNAFHDPVGSVLRDTDALLSEDVEVAIRQHASAKQPFDTLGEALISSYVGVPDMIRTLLTWCGAASLDAPSILRESTKNVLKKHEHRVVDNLEPVLLSSIPNHLLRPLAVSAYWRGIALSIASEHPVSAFSYELNRENALADAQIPVTIFKSPQVFSIAFREIIESALSVPPVSNDDMNALYNRIALVSTYDQCVTLSAIRILAPMRNADSPVLRAIAINALHAIRLAVFKVARNSSYASIADARRFSISINLLVDSVLAGTKLDKMYLVALQALVLPINPSHHGKRRHDKYVALLAATYNAMLGDPGATGCDDDGDEVVETGSEMDLNPNAMFVLLRALCYPEIREDIAKGLFTVEHRVGGFGTGNDRKCQFYCSLLSHSYVVACESDDSLRKKLASTDCKMNLRKAIDKLSHRFGAVVVLCDRIRIGTTLKKGSKRNMEGLLAEVRNPFIADGVLMWASDGLLCRAVAGRTNISERVVFMNAKRYLTVLETIAQRHDIQLYRVLTVVHDAFCRDFNERVDASLIEDFQMLLLKNLASWVGLRFGADVLTHFKNVWLDDDLISGFHIRAFVNSVLNGLEAPYSKTLASSLSSVLRHDRVETAVSEDSKLVAMVFEFRKNYAV